MDALVRLCNRYQVTLYTSELDSFEKGATLSFGVPEESFGIEGAHKARKILLGANPIDIPISSVKNFKIKINKKGLDSQGLNLSDSMIFLLENGELS